MLFEWIKKILGIDKQGFLSKKEQIDNSASELNLLDGRREDAISAKRNLDTTSIDWYSITPHKEKVDKNISIFTRYNFSDIVTFKYLKEERIRKEQEKLAALESLIQKKLFEVKSLIEKEKIQEANTYLSKIQTSIPLVRNYQILNLYQEVLDGIHKLQSVLEKRELQRITEEQRKQKEIARLREEEQERKRREIEEQKKREREAREIAAQKRAEQVRQKEQSELAERRRLNNLCNEKKANSEGVKNILQINGITYFYHFTDRSNIPSIKRHGGLFSWKYSENHGINIPYPGGGDLSRELDMRYGLQDYVRLSFCKEHPMKFVAIKDGRIQQPVVLLINTEVAYLKNTLFSDMNATKTGHHKGGNLEDLNKVKFNIVKQPNHFDLDGIEKSYYQAEILVKTWIPIKYIINIDGV